MCTLSSVSQVNMDYSPSALISDLSELDRLRGDIILKGAVGVNVRTRVSFWKPNDTLARGHSNQTRRLVQLGRLRRQRGEANKKGSLGLLRYFWFQPSASFCKYFSNFWAQQCLTTTRFSCVKLHCMAHFALQWNPSFADLCA